MSDVQCVFVIGPDTPAELVLFAASIGRALARGNDIRFVDEDPEELLVRDATLSKLRISGADVAPDRARLVMCGDSDFVQGRAIGNIWRLSLVTDGTPSVRLETEGRRFGFPLAMAAPILRRFGRSLSEVPRIVVSATDLARRRERMLVRACQELAVRRFPHTLVTITPSATIARDLGASEAYLRPEASELASLVASATVVLETVEGDEPPSPLGCLASSVGVPVVTHATSILVRQGGGELRTVAEWSPDAFADAVIESVATVPGDLSWGAEFDAVAEDFGRAIQSA